MLWLFWSLIVFVAVLLIALFIAHQRQQGAPANTRTSSLAIVNVFYVIRVKDDSTRSSAQECGVLERIHRLTQPLRDALIVDKIRLITMDDLNDFLPRITLEVLIRDVLPSDHKADVIVQVTTTRIPGKGLIELRDPVSLSIPRMSNRLAEAQIADAFCTEVLNAVRHAVHSRSDT